MSDPTPAIAPRGLTRKHRFSRKTAKGPPRMYLKLCCARHGTSITTSIRSHNMSTPHSRKMTTRGRVIGCLTLGLTLVLFFAYLVANSIASEIDLPPVDTEPQDYVAPDGAMLDVEDLQTTDVDIEPEEANPLYVTYFFDDFDSWSGWSCAAQCSGCCSYYVYSGSLRLSPYSPCSGRGDPYCSLAGPYRNIWIRNLPPEAPRNQFVLATKVNAYFNRDYSQAGLIIWFGPDSYVKLVKIRDGGVRKVQLYAEGFGITDGIHCPYARFREIPFDSAQNNTLTLIVRPSGSSVQLLAQVDSTFVGSMTLPSWPASIPGCSSMYMAVGLLCYGSLTGDSENSAAFSWFRIRSE